MGSNPFRFAPTRGLPAVPTRDQVKSELAAAFRVLHALDMGLGVAGHLSARDPLEPETFWVNPFGLAYGRIRAHDLSRVSHDGRLLEGAPINAAAFAIHAAVHEAHPRISCVMHGHPPHATAWSALGRLLAPINQDVCALYGSHTLYEEDSAVVVERDEGRRIAQALGDHKGAFLRNHGPLAAGQSVAEALWWFVLMERSARIELLVRQGAPVHQLPHEQATDIARAIGTPAFGAFQGLALLEAAPAPLPPGLDVP